ncbi:MAG: hypothetical protein EOQ30_03955 [Mesorhizobium sp.]|nr:MAG: hypothetical protein EOQ29_01230 [Mesorhizobium sp.]RWA85948.1 MAG: hypothetical protein EOQ30_03955 [Mesorhizobium sp.]
MTNWPTAAIARRPKFRIDDRSLGLNPSYHSRAAADEVQPSCMSPKSAQRFWEDDMQNKDLKRVA